MEGEIPFTNWVLQHLPRLYCKIAFSVDCMLQNGHISVNRKSFHETILLHHLSNTNTTYTTDVKKKRFSEKSA